MSYESQPSRRLVTQNLLASAARFEDVNTKMDWGAIQDLSALIDLYCLYDRIHTLGPYGLTEHQAPNFDFLHLLQQSNFIEVECPTQSDNLVETTHHHLLAYLSEGPNIDGEQAHQEPLFMLSVKARSALYFLLSRPDREAELQAGRRWLEKAPTQSDLLDPLSALGGEGSGALFLLRTFLYLGYADVGRYSLTPDHVRGSVLSHVIDTEEQFRGELLRTLQDSWESQLGDRKLLNRVSPFAAIVFARSGKKKARIIPEMQRLRQELEPDRRRLRELEDRILWGKNLVERQGAAKKLELAFEEIAKDFNAPGIFQITSRFPLNFGEVLPAVAGAIDDPAKWSSWAELLLALPTEVPKTVAARRTLINTHQLIGSDDLPGVEQLRRYIRTLFDMD